MSDLPAVPAAMVEAAARARREHVAQSHAYHLPPSRHPIVDGEERSTGWYWTCTCGARRDEMDFESGYASRDEAQAHENLAVLAAALGVCEVREEWGARLWLDGDPDDKWDDWMVSRSQAQRRVASHAAKRADPLRSWGGNARLIRRRWFATPAEPVDTEGGSDAA